MSVLSFKVPTEEQLILQSAINNSVVLTPKQKFDKHVKKVTLGNPKRIGIYHFKAIEHGKLVILYNGLGKELGQFNNDLKGNRECRSFAFDKYNTDRHNRTIVGGYKFDFVKEIT